MAKATELLERLVTLQEQQMGMLQGGGQAASSSSSDYSAGSQRAASALRRGAVRGALGGSVGDGDTAATKEAAAAAREYADALESLRVGIKELSGPMTQQRKNQEMLAIAVTKNTIASRKLSGEQKKGEGRIAKSNSLYYGLQDRIQGITVAMESWEQATQEVDAVQGSLFRTIGRGMGSGLGKLGVSVGVVAVALQGLALQSRNAKFHMQAMFELGMSPARALAQHDMIFSDYNRVMNDAAETAMDFGASSDDARQMVSNLTSALRIPLSGRSVESYAKEVDSLVVSLHAVEVLGVKNEEATAAWESQIYGMGKSSRYALQMVRDLQTSVYDLGRRYEGKVKPEVFANIALGLADSTDTWVSGFDQAVASMHVVYDEALKVTGMGGKMMEATERITKQMREVPEWFQFHMGAKFLQDAEGNTNRFQKVMKSLGESERKAFQFLLDSDLAPFRQAQVLGKELMNTVHGAESLAEFVKGFGGTGGTEMLIQLGFNPKDAAIFMHALGESGVGGIQDRLIEIRKQGVAFGDKLNDMAADAKWRGGWMESLANNAAALMNNTWFSVSALAAVATWRALMIGQMVTQTGLMGTLVAQGMGGTAAQIGSTAARTGGALADAADTATDIAVLKRGKDVAKQAGRQGGVRGAARGALTKLKPAGRMLGKFGRGAGAPLAALMAAGTIGYGMFGASDANAAAKRSLDQGKLHSDSLRRQEYTRLSPEYQADIQAARAQASAAASAAYVHSQRHGGGAESTSLMSPLEGVGRAMGGSFRTRKAKQRRFGYNPDDARVEASDDGRGNAKVVVVMPMEQGVFDAMEKNSGLFGIGR